MTDRKRPAWSSPVNRAKNDAVYDITENPLGILNDATETTESVFHGPTAARLGKWKIARYY